MVIITLQTLSNIIKQGLNPGIKNILQAWHKSTWRWLVRRWTMVMIKMAPTDKTTLHNAYHIMADVVFLLATGGDRLTRLIICPALLQNTPKLSVSLSLAVCFKNSGHAPLSTSHRDLHTRVSWVRAIINNCWSFDLQNRRQTWSGHANLHWGHSIRKTQVELSECVCVCLSVNVH